MQATIQALTNTYPTARQGQFGLRRTTLALSLALFLSAGLSSTGDSELSILDSDQDMSLRQIRDHLSLALPEGQKEKSDFLAKKIRALAQQYRLSPTLVLSVIEAESSFRPEVISKAGAIGLMQVLPRTAQEVARRYGIPYHSAHDLKNPETNLRIGVAYLAYLRRRFGHSYHYLAAYNLGPSALKSRLRAGRFELGQVEFYVQKIQTKTLLLRKQNALFALEKERLAASL